jgi:hypothetical protein
MLFKSKKPTFAITVAQSVLNSVFDECDRFDADETGGRLLGTYKQNKNRLEIEVTGVLEPGPNAQRTPTFFLQDGDYQEQMFRAIEASHPEIEHLGNWHTHHVNGLQTLSGGDKSTYNRVVNHAKHNTDFFYALLVTNKSRGKRTRYDIKHFVFRRGDDTFYEVPNSEVRIADVPLLQAKAASLSRTSHSANTANLQRVRDQDFFSEFYPGMKVLLAKEINAPYWKGALSLVDGSRAEVVAVEDPEDKNHSYSILSSSKHPALEEILQQYRLQKFPSARQAVFSLERDLNNALFLHKRG